MSQDKEYEVQIEQIECENCLIPKDKDAGICGVVLTGFIDVEKLITVKHNYKEEKLFLEKKLPFYIVLLNLRTQNDFTKPKNLLFRYNCILRYFYIVASTNG
ncbi:hypothetical protein [Bacillus thuringiensis]|uniref:hypothetical protein n=1 Tax=Bacillus thuringiensis TaxID=1428 RepID=UPI000CD83635|nr:hypothetical protein [Bacillus thuringiensis]